MSDKTYLPAGETPPASQIGATLEALAATIAARRDAGEESYTHRLLAGPADDVLKKVMEEAGETASPGPLRRSPPRWRLSARTWTTRFP